VLLWWVGLSSHPLAPRFLPAAGQLLDDFERGERRMLYGANELVIPVKGVGVLMAEEMIHPFFMFQYASVAIW
jgi:cation-transporting ATPase 13A3/4/5